MIITSTYYFFTYANLSLRKYIFKYIKMSLTQNRTKSTGNSEVIHHNSFTFAVIF